jgi:hypothetical protein
MTSDSEREQDLRRLLAEAVEPVEPGPGAQTRLLARARSQAQHKRRRRADVLRWAVPVTIVSLALVFLATVGVIASRNDSGSSKGASTSTAGGSSSISSPEAGPDSAAAAASPSRAAKGSLTAPAVPVPSALSSEKAANGASSGTTQFSNDLRASALPLPDLDGDGRLDTFAISAGKLIATLSSDGVQSVMLPPMGAGARVLDVTALTDPSGNTVPALFVRLQQSGSTFTDTVVVLVSGRLTVLEKGSQALLLTVDGAHGYGCNQKALALSGDNTPYVVDGAQLVASPLLRAVQVPVGKSLGC